MNTKKNIQIILTFIVAFITFSCSSDSSADNVSLKAKATLNPAAKNSSLAQKNNAVITISGFIINIKEIEFDMKDDDLENENLHSEIELQGPFELDLSSGNVAIDITSVDLPIAVYDKIQFKLHKSVNELSDMFGKSIQIKGDLNGIPFVFWHDIEEEVEVDYVNSTIDIVVNGTTEIATINFDLSAIFGAASTVDFSGVTDGNGNGIIEINPNNDDGNAAFADFLKNLLEEHSDLDED
ncbi:hypothetical protein [Lutibacter sp.]|uniref:hypothetical protein n=1 Tax=Lutibacter sp. TaxID=1925666 RepID=UPI00356304B1